LKKATQDLLVCPACRSSLALQETQTEEGEILRGELSCRCGKRYPIRDGIAEFVKESYAGSFSFQWLAQPGTEASDALTRTVKLSFLESLGVDPASLRGRRVLDAGCGRGALTQLLAEHGAEVIGLDLSDGVRVAAMRMRGKPGASILRGDILEPPLAEGSFDAIFSFGVLHHTRDCRAAFLSLARLLRPGGLIGIWVYSAYSTYRNKASDFLRRFTTRMPRRLLYLLCHFAVPLNYLQQIPVLGVPLRIIPVAGEGPWRWQILGTFDWYSPTFQSKHTFPEVAAWFEEAGLERIRVHDWNICVSGRRPPS
jgi:SAM-dependent methyltransferase